jgi:hypothetical protein
MFHVMLREIVMESWLNEKSSYGYTFFGIQT